MSAKLYFVQAHKTMITLNDLLAYARTALDWAAIPEEETEFRSILTELIVVSAQIPITFLSENYGNRVKIISDVVKIPERKLAEWLSQQDEVKSEYYVERLMLFLKAYATIEAKSHPSKNEINETYSFLQEILQDRMDIDNDEEMRATFTPFVEHIGKVMPPKEILADTPFNLSSEWPHDKSKLIELSNDLWEENFTESKDAFAWVFNTNVNRQCNWLQSRNTLLYLLWLLYGEGSEKNTSKMVSLCVDKFLIKGKPTDKKTAQSTNIKVQIDKNESHLSGKFEILYSIVKSINFQ